MRLSRSRRNRDARFDAALATLERCRRCHPRTTSTAVFALFEWLR
jgi:hypothetical protein